MRVGLCTARRNTITAALLVVGALLPSVAPASAAPKQLRATVPATSFLGERLVVTGTVGRWSGGKAEVGLQRHDGKRWLTMAKAKVKPRATFSLAFQPSVKKRSVRVRVRLRRNGRTVATSKAVIVALVARPKPNSTSTPTPSGPSTSVPPVPGGGTTAPPVAGGGTPPTAPVRFRVGPVTVAPGTAADIPVPSQLTGFTQLSLAGAATGSGFSVSAIGALYRLSAGMAVAPQSASVQLAGTACDPSACDVPVEVTVDTVVVPIAAPTTSAVDGFSAPSPERAATGVSTLPGVVDLSDQLTVTLGTPDAVGSRSDADAIAAAVGGLVSGGLESLGVYELRWLQPQDLDARMSQISAMPGVIEVSRVSPGINDAMAEPPGDWSDDRGNSQATWPYTQIRAQQAWDVTTGGSTKVGIVDVGEAFADHEDLNVVRRLGGGSAEHHATHVAGLACARANGKGVVGVAWGCPIVTAGIGGGTDEEVLEAATRAAEDGARVINLSLGYADDHVCHSQAAQNDLIRRAQAGKRKFRSLFQGEKGRDVIWTIAAGNNCAVGVPSPYGANGDLPNVITVGATNDDGRLGNFSDFGDDVEVAAPGGVSAGDAGVWSTSVHRCFVFWRCGTYARDWGTSMAAPVVAGVAALVRENHPDLGAADAASCIVQSAGLATGRADERADDEPSSRDPIVTFSGSIPIVDARASVDCDAFDSTRAGAYVGTWTNGSWTLDMAEESPGRLGAINQSTTPFINGCSHGPGLKIITAMELDSASGQWNGDTVTVDSSCTRYMYNGRGAMRAVREGDGRIVLVMAWSRWSNGARPSIDADGNVTSVDEWYSIQIERPSGRRTTSSRRGALADDAASGALSAGPGTERG